MDGAVIGDRINGIAGAVLCLAAFLVTASGCDQPPPPPAPAANESAIAGRSVAEFYGRFREPKCPRLNASGELLRESFATRPDNTATWTLDCRYGPVRRVRT